MQKNEMILQKNWKKMFRQNGFRMSAQINVTVYLFHIYTNVYSRIPVNNHITANEYVFWTYYYVSFHFNVLKQRIRKLVKSTTLTLHILKIKSRLNLKLSEDSWLIIDYHLILSRSLHSRVKKEAIFGLFLRSLFALSDLI